MTGGYKNLIPEFQNDVMRAESCEEILTASFKFIQFHGGFSSSPESRAKFLVRMKQGIKAA